jgi:hypothetical protein
MIHFKSSVFVPAISTLNSAISVFSSVFNSTISVRTAANSAGLGGEIRQIGLGGENREFGLGGEIAVARFAQGLGQGFGLFGREMPFVPEDARKPERIKEKRVHAGTMRRRVAKVQCRPRGCRAGAVFIPRAHARLPIGHSGTGGTLR